MAVFVAGPLDDPTFHVGPDCKRIKIGEDMLSFGVIDNKAESVAMARMQMNVSTKLEYNVVRDFHNIQH
jgi:hypothetical protein